MFLKRHYVYTTNSKTKLTLFLKGIYWNSSVMFDNSIKNMWYFLCFRVILSRSICSAELAVSILESKLIGDHASYTTPHPPGSRVRTMYAYQVIRLPHFKDCLTTESVYILFEIKVTEINSEPFRVCKLFLHAPSRDKLPRICSRQRALSHEFIEISRQRIPFMVFSFALIPFQQDSIVCVDTAKHCFKHVLARALSLHKFVKGYQVFDSRGRLLNFHL